MGLEAEAVSPGKEGAGVCEGMRTVKAKKEMAQVWLQEKKGATQGSVVAAPWKNPAALQ